MYSHLFQSDSRYRRRAGIYAFKGRHSLGYQISELQNHSAQAFADEFQDNVVISESGKAMICDFGSSRMIAPSRTLANITSTPKGTLQFWAPELVSSDEVARHSKATDVWAFGMVVFVCCMSAFYDGI